jgi:hypothetical protein
MSIKAKLKAAVNKASKIKGGPGDDVQNVQEVRAGGNVFKGPFARVKAKKSIKKGETNVSYAKKKGLGGREKLIRYEDSGTMIGKDTNIPFFMKKTVTSPSERTKIKYEKFNEKFKNKD